MSLTNQKANDNVLASCGLSQIYKDAELLAVDKPPGLLMHPSWLDKGQVDTLVARVKRVHGRRWQPVHRLDRPTSGLVLFSASPSLTHWLQQHWSWQQKVYWAVVRGHLLGQGEIDHPLVPVQDDYAEGDLAAKEAVAAVSRYRHLASSELPVALGRYASARYSLVELQPLTGRQHQLRRHMKHLFHPILGDTTYGEGRHNRLQRQRTGLQQLMLRSVALRLRLPDDRSLRLDAPLSPDWQLLLADYGLLPAKLGQLLDS